MNTLNFRKKCATLLKIIMAILFLLTLCFTTLWFAPKPLLLDKVSFSKIIYDANHRLIRLTLSQDEKFRLYTPLSKVSANFLDAIVLKEDHHFYSHPGVNPFAMAKAFWRTYVLQRRRIGASTITMQLARLRYKIDTHRLFGKIKQIIMALRIERYYTKQQILEAYVNLLPFGNNIEGIGAASLIYYHKQANSINVLQAIMLSIIPQHPQIRSLQKSNYNVVMQERNKLFYRWAQTHQQGQEFAQFLRLPNSNYTIKDLSFLAPHFAEWLLRLHPQQFVFNSTLDLKLQQTVTQVVKRYVTEKNNAGINNVAALLVDTDTMEVKAMLGSADYFNKKIEGQVNGVAAKRSPGSTLKPFVYALALDQGLIHPATVLKDAPLSFANYDPENFDRDFLGPISASEALIQSRNIPALYLTNQLHTPSFYQFLKRVGLQLKPESQYGLSLVLGGAEISMQELVELYAMLANEGKFHKLRLLKNQPLDSGQQLLSREASFLVLDMLVNNPRPDQVNLASLTHIKQTPVAWKTGTSSAFRDAWTVGSFDHYVLAVWIGNFNGASNNMFVGRKVTAPLFFAIIDALLPQLDKKLNPQKWQNLNLTKVKVCKDSGMLPTHACPGTKTTWFIPGKSPIHKDNIFREVMIDAKTGKRACHFDPQNRFEIFEFWPSDLLQIFKQAGIARRVPPPYDPDCHVSNQASNGIAPQIVSPRKGLTYTVSRRLSNTSTIPLIATIEADVQTLHWFVNESYIGKSKRDEPLWWQPKPGHFVVRAVDEWGRTDAVDILIKNVH